jgi:hypothetical protein
MYRVPIGRLVMSGMVPVCVFIVLCFSTEVQLHFIQTMMNMKGVFNISGSQVQPLTLLSPQNKCHFRQRFLPSVCG